MPPTGMTARSLQANGYGRRARRRESRGRAAIVSATLEVLESRQLLSVAALVKDVNTSSAPSQPTSFVSIGSTMYFTANDGVHGTELWKSDSTATGTSMVVDLTPGSASTVYGGLTAAGGKLFFATSGGLWASDGTAAGTVPVGPANQLAYNLTAAGDRVYYGGAGADGTELWTSDGTVAGTYEVKDINPGSTSSSPTGFTAMGGYAYFSANDGVHGTELWRTDGTAQGTTLVADVNPATAGSSYPSSLTATPAGILYFAAYEPVHGTELWKTDGTAAGTSLVKDLAASGTSSYLADISSVDGGSTVYFQEVVNNIPSLYKTDGTSAGTVLLQTFANGSGLIAPVTAVNGTDIFWAGSALWQTDGTAAGTTTVATGQQWGIRQVQTSGGAAFYIGYDNGNTNPILWRTDGTAAGTVKVEALTGVTLQTTAGSLMGDLNGTLFYADAEPKTVAPGAMLGTQLADVNPLQPYGSNPQLPGVAGGKAYFLANDGQHTPGEELWVTDGTAAGTQFLHDFGTSFGSTYVSAYPHADLDGSYLFGTSGQLWRSDGSPDTTSPIAAYTGGAVRLIASAGNFAYVLGSNPAQGLLWRTDGTDAGTYALNVPALQYVNPIYSTDTSRFVTPGGTLIFVGEDASHGYELWSSDGTSAGTGMIADLAAGGTSSSPSNLTRFNGAVYFTASNGSVQQVYKTDGTAAGTVPVDAINTALAAAGLATVPSFSSFTPMGSKLFFSVATSAYGPELWVYDAATDHAQLLKDVFPGNANYPYPMNPTVVGNHLYFVDSADSGSNFQLWQSDGTTAGTVQLTDRPWAPSQYLPQLQNLTAAGDALFFTNGSQLYEVQESATGVQIVPVSVSDPFGKPLAPVDAQTLIALGDNLLFTANDGTLGSEPYIVSGTPQLAADAGGPYHVAEGQSVTLSAAASTAGGSPIVSYEWDLSGATGGSFHADATGPTVTLSNLDGPAIKYVALRVTDAAGDVSYAQAVVYVTNTPPTVSISGPTVTLPEGSTYTINLSAGNDPGQDTITSWRIDWGDGTIQTITGNPATAAHAYGHGTRHYTISALATDEDGSYSTNSLAIGLADPSFGNAGVSTIAGLFAGQRVAQLPDGHLLTAGADANGDVTLARFNADGSLDTTFASGGSATINIPGASSVSALQLTPDGKIVVGTSPGWLIARFNADGSLDPTFGSAGVANPPSAGALHDMKVLDDGSIVAAGQIDDGSARGGLNFAALKLKPDGSLDTSFGNAGVAHLDFGYGNDTATSVAVLPDGKILLGGTVNQPVGTTTYTTECFGLTRLTAGGQLDTTFGKGGFSAPSLSTVGKMTATSMAIDPVAQKIYVAGGSAQSDAGEQTLILRYNLADGSLDTSYGQNGKWSDDPYGNGDIASIAVDAEGNVTYVTLWSFNNSVRIGRVTPKGVDDGVWGGGSAFPAVRYPQFDATAKTLGNVVLTPDGRVLAVVQSQLGTGLGEMATEVPQIGIDITDVPPTDADIGPDRTVDEGSAVPMTATYTDPGFADTFTYLWHVTAGNGQVIADGSTKNFTFTPTDNGIYTVQFTVTDDMGYSSSASATVTVNNVAPSVNLGPDRSTNEGTGGTFTAIVSDPSTIDSQSLQYHWTATLNGNVVAQSTTTTLTYTPPDDGLYTIALTVTDKDGGVGSASYLLTVLNVPPTITLSGASTITPGTTYYLTASKSDPGADTVKSWTIDWGDGTTPVTQSFAPHNLTHLYAGTGRFTITVSATDEDGTWFAIPKPVWVQSGPVLGSDGTLTITGTASDDNVSISQSGTALISVTQNAVAYSFTASSVQRIVANLLDGDDALGLAFNVTAPLAFDGGAGHDSLSVSTASTTGSTMTLTPTSLAGVSGAATPDTFANLEALSITGNTGNDSLSIDAATALAVTYSPGNGADTLSFTPATGPTAGADTAVTLANGLATVGATSVNYSQLETLSITTGGGNDTFTIDYSQGAPLPSNARAFLDGGGGANTLVARGSTAADSFSLSATGFGRSGDSSGFNLSHFQAARFIGGDGGSHSITVYSGTWTIDADTATGTPNQSVTVFSNAVTFAGTQHLAGLNIPTGGHVALPNVPGVQLVVGSLLMDATGSLDLAQGQLLMSTSFPVWATNLHSYLQAAYNGGKWDGLGGITSSVVKSNPQHYALGYAAAGEPNVTTAVPAGYVLVRPTMFADTNLDGAVTNADVSAMIAAGHYLDGTTNNSWAAGDWNYDGKVDNNDISNLIASGNYLSGQQYNAPVAPAAVSAAVTTSSTPATTPGDIATPATAPVTSSPPQLITQEPATPDEPIEATIGPASVDGTASTSPKPGHVSHAFVVRQARHVRHVAHDTRRPHRH